MFGNSLTAVAVASVVIPAEERPFPVASHSVTVKLALCNFWHTSAVG